MVMVVYLCRWSARSDVEYAQPRWLQPCADAAAAEDPVENENDEDDDRFSVEADGGCGGATVLESGELWADVGGSARDQTCIVGGDVFVDRGELPNRGEEMMAPETAGTAVTVAEQVPHRGVGRMWVSLIDGR